MTPGKSARTKPAGEQIWLRSPWPLLLAICGAAAIWTLAAGNPFEGLEMRWFGQVLKWRYERQMAPPADPMESSLLGKDVTITRDDRQPRAYRFMVGDNSEIGIL